MEFLPDISKWVQILLRWGHVFFAILWVGTSFTFNYLDNKLPKNLNGWQKTPTFQSLVSILSCGHRNKNMQQLTENLIF